MPARCRFPRSARLLRPNDFETAFQRGRRHTAKLLSAVAAPAACQNARLGLTVSKKIAPRACDRNRIKRYIRESFRLNLHRLPAVDIVISARPGAGAASPGELRDLLNHLWTRIAQSCAAS